jgi:hypothetical protein
MKLPKKLPYMNDIQQEKIIEALIKFYNEGFEIALKCLNETGLTITVERMLQFVFLVILKLSFGLSRGSTLSLLSSGQAEKVKRFITQLDQKFPGNSTASIRMLQVIETCRSEINALAERVQDYFYVSLGDYFRELCKYVHKSTQTAFTPPPEVFIGIIPPSKAFPDLSVEERGRLFPFFNAKLFMLYNKITGIAELIGKLKVPKFKNGTMKFSLAGRLGFFCGPPGKNTFYDSFKEIKHLIDACDDFLNKTLAHLQITDVTIVTVDTTNIPVDKRDKTGSIGTGSRGTFFGHKSSIAVDANCIPLNETFGTGHESDSSMFPGTFLPVKTLADQTGQEIWCVALDAIYSVLMVIFLIEGMNAVPFIEINPKNSSLLKLLKEKAAALKHLSKKALTRMPREEKLQWRRQLSDISKAGPSPIPLEQKKKQLKIILHRFGSRAMRKGLSIGEKQAAKRLRREVMGIRRKIRLHGTFYEKIIGLSAIAHGTIEWLLVYSIRGQNEGINGILKKRGDIIGDGQHTTWQLGNLNLSNQVSFAQIGLKVMVLVKFIITGQQIHHLRWVHNWKRKKIFFCHVIFIIFSRENPPFF